MNALFYRTGGTLNFKWLKADVDDVPAAKLALFKAGYPTVVAAAAPVDFAPVGMMANPVMAKACAFADDPGADLKMWF